MSNRTHGALAGAGMALPWSAALAASQEDALASMTMLMLYGGIAFVIVVVVAVYFMNAQDPRQARLGRVFEWGGAVYGVGPRTLVADAVRTMTSRGIGAVVVLEGETLAGIFTERDALNRVLAAGRDPTAVAVCEVMTADPIRIAPSTTVGEAMDLITTRRFRHLPVVEQGRLVGLVSSGDLMRWLLHEQPSRAPELERLAAQF